MTNTISEYGSSLETGSVDPEEYIPKFLQALEQNGSAQLLEEVSNQLSTFQSAS